MRVLIEERGTLFLCDLSKVGSLFDKLCKFEFIILLIFEQFADFEACQFTANIVLWFDRVEKAQGCDGLVDDGPELEVVNQVHRLTEVILLQF